MDSAFEQGAVQAAIGSRYTLERELGRGGTATVYLGQDLRHRRHVAIKVLHPELSAALGPERFLREIELTASLQHPHILPLFDSGSADGLLYYVMPFVDGETLRAKLDRERQLPVEEAVRLAREVADALGYAHSRGVVHRDIKPENILLQGGRALVADFGIALAVQQAGGERLTGTGISLGTPQYMSPEQAMSDTSTDARTDIYALGTVAYEMLAGEPPFTAPSAQGIVAKMLTEKPAAISLRRPSVPPHVELAVLTALEKLPADRFESTAAFAAALSDPRLLDSRVARGAAPVAARLGRRPIPPRLAATLAVGALAIAALAWAGGRATGRAAMAGMAAGAAGRGVVRFTIDVDSGSFGGGGLAISPDGRTVVYAIESADGARLYARRVDDLVARPLAGTEDGSNPFFSPDGDWVAFYSRGALRKVRLAGGSAVTVTEVSPSLEFNGGSWVGDAIVYAVYWNNALYRVAAGGGVASRIAVADTTVALTAPQLLPGGAAVLVTATPIGASTGDRLGVLDLASGRLRRFGPGLAPRYVGGQIVYSTLAGDLYRQPFDLGRMEPNGSAEQIASGLAFGMGGAVPFDVSSAGALVYKAGGSEALAANLKLTLTDRAGRELRAVPARLPWAPRFSPDGGRVAYGANARGRDSSDVWVTELESGATERLTTDANENNDPQWSPNGKLIAYSANADGAKDLFIKGESGGSARSLTRRPGYQYSADWIRDGSAVLFIDVPLTGQMAGNQSIWVQPMDGSEARPYVATAAHELGARASPDGRWVAFHSNETGRDEVYVESYPTPGRKTLVSNHGGLHPTWRRDAAELYYWEGDQLVAVRLAVGAANGPVVVRDRTPLFRASYPGGVNAMYDVSPDGSRFIIAAGHERANRLVVTLNALRSDSVDAPSATTER